MMTLLSVSELLGRFHPVFVHLPVGILVIACLFMWQSSSARFAYLKPAVQPLLFWGMLSAVVSCITGLLLSQGDDYDSGLVGWHQWLGIGVAVLSLTLYLIRRKVFIARWQNLSALLLLVLVMVTGHFGGSLTHGSDYLTASFQGLGEDSGDVFIPKPIPDVQEAVVYTDIVQPIFKSKCYSCHGPTKQKGRLRMDQPDLLMKGGKNGEVILAGNALESEIIKRLSLPLEDEHHMPPKEKSQLNDPQVALIHWWITQGADFNKKVKELEQPEKLQPALLALEKDEEKKQVPAIPLTTVDKADETAVRKLKKRGVIILPVGDNSNYLLANFVNTDSVSNKEMQLLLPLKKQLVWLKLGNTTVGDSSMSVVGQCTNLTRLQLDHTNITDKGLLPLKALTGLQTLNLVGTKVTSDGIKALANLKQLQTIYLYQTNVSRQGFMDLTKAFPQTQIDSGGYSVPFLQTDTMIARPPVK